MGWRRSRTVTFVKWRDDDLLPEGRGLFHSRRIHQAALQVEGTACPHQYLALFCGIWWHFGWFWLWWRIVWRLQRVACQVEGMSCSVLEEHFSIAFGEQFRIQIILSSSCQDKYPQTGIFHARCFDCFSLVVDWAPDLLLLLLLLFGSWICDCFLFNLPYVVILGPVLNSQRRLLRKTIIFKFPINLEFVFSVCDGLS